MTLTLESSKVKAGPGMSNFDLVSQIEEMVSKYAICAELQNSNLKEPMTCAELPSSPWSRIASGIFTLHQSNYLLTVHYYSKWREIIKMTERSSRYVISALKSQFSKYDILDELVTDNGPQYSWRRLTTLRRSMNLYTQHRVHFFRILTVRPSEPYRQWKAYSRSIAIRINRSWTTAILRSKVLVFRQRRCFLY